MAEKTAFQSKIESLRGYIRSYQEEIDILIALGDIKGAGAYSVWTWRDEIRIEPTGEVTAREVVLSVLASLKAKGAAPTKATKTFDAETGKVTFTIDGPKAGWKIAVSGGEPRCKVKEVIEEYMVPEKPAIAAHLATRKKFIIENPEECGAEVAS